MSDENTGLSREQWLARCATRFRLAAAVPPDEAMSLAESQLEILDDDLTESPEQAADDELSYWGD